MFFGRSAPPGRSSEKSGRYTRRENFLDPPTSPPTPTPAEAWLGLGDAARLSADADRPWGKADLFYVAKLAAAIEAADE